jgi:hypothetical protein
VTGFVVLVPFGLAVWRATGTAQWRGDLHVVRDLGLAAVGVGGTLSTVVTQALALLPLGSYAYRAALGSALALAVGALLLLGIARHVLATVRVGAEPLPAPLASLLSGVGVSAAALSPTWQQEATVGGGATYAAVAVLAAVALTLKLTDPRARSHSSASAARWLLLATACSAALAESIPAGLAAIVVAIIAMALSGRVPPARVVPWMLLSFLVVLLVLSAPLALRAFTPRSLADVGRALSATSLEPLRAAATRTTALEAWLSEVGIVSLGLAALGVTVAAWRRVSRSSMVPLVALVVVDLAYPLVAASGLGPDRLIALRVLAVAALAVASAAGVGALVGFLRSLRVPMARSASVLTVVFYLSVVAVTCEEAGFATDRSESFAAEVWTDEALGALPPRAAVLVHSPELAWRLWACRMWRGARPDVVVVPAPLLHHTRVMASLMPVEPRIVPLLRDFALTGEASEFSLSALADQRPLYVELGADWDDRIIGHLSIEGPWLRYHPETLGKSDREPQRQEMWAPSGPLVRALLADAPADDLTAHVVARTLKEHAATLSLLGMRQHAELNLERIERIDAQDPFLTGARLRMAHAEATRRKDVELRDLLRF